MRENGPSPNTIGWAVGKGKSVNTRVSTVGNARLGFLLWQTAKSLISFDSVSNWAKDFGTGFVQDLLEKNLKMWSCKSHTALGIIEAHPMPESLNSLKRLVTTDTSAK